MTATDTPSLHRVLRVRDGLAVTVGIVIGAGILRTPGLIAGYLGDAWLILGVWVVGGIVAALSTLVLLGYFRLRRRQPDLHRPFRVPAHPWIPGLTVVLYVGIVAILVGTQPSLAVGGGSMIGGMVLAGWLTTRRGRAAAESTR